jgi:hypothetical protein
MGRRLWDMISVVKSHVKEPYASFYFQISNEELRIEVSDIELVE